MAGSARKRGRTWTALWREDGKQRSRGGFPTKSEALTYAARKHVEASDGDSMVRSDITVHAYLKQWLASRHSISDRTREIYADNIARIPENIAERRLATLRDHHVQAMINELLTAQYSDDDELIRPAYAPRTIRETVRTLRMACRIAVHQRLLRANPASSPVIEMPSIPSGPPRVLTPVQIEAVCQELDERHELLMRFLLSTQVRLGEALGLIWADIDWEEQTVRIERSAGRYAGGIGELKTPASRRTISLDPQTITVLQRQRERQQVEREAMPIVPLTDRVFTTVRGNPMSHAGVAYAFRHAGQRASVPGFHAHLLRHTGASWLLKDRVPVTIVSQRLGHANPAITMSVYAHALPDDDEIAAAAMEAMLRRTSDNR